ncbi:uncharacterized protein LOC144341724 [Saccoglossus kowalevskii]
MAGKMVTRQLILVFMLIIVFLMYCIYFTWDLNTNTGNKMVNQMTLAFNHTHFNYRPEETEVNSNNTHHLEMKLLKGIKILDVILDDRNQHLHLTDDMLDVAYTHHTSLELLQYTLLKVVTKGGPLKIGIIGGSTSLGAKVGGPENYYFNILAGMLRSMLRVEVEIYNAAVAASDSRYYEFCMENHLNLHDLDIILWELAVNDYVAGLRPFAQEDLTRHILSQGSKPQLIYVNFVTAVNTLRRSCFSNERLASEPLSEHYDIPSVSLSNAMCSRIREGKAKNLVAIDSYHPSEKAHSMVAVILAHMFRRAALRLTHRLLSSPFEFYEFITENKELKVLREPLFPESRVIHPQCWSALSTREHAPTLEPMHMNGWHLTHEHPSEDSTTYIKETANLINYTVWTTSKKHNDITFSINIEPFHKYLAIIFIGMLGCPSCGKARVILDEDVENSRVLHNEWPWTRIMTHRVHWYVISGHHSLTIHSVNNKPLALISIMAAYNTNSTSEAIPCPPNCIENGYNTESEFGSESNSYDDDSLEMTNATTEWESHAISSENTDSSESVLFEQEENSSDNTEDDDFVNFESVVSKNTNDGPVEYNEASTTLPDFNH